MATYTEIANIQDDPLWNDFLSKIRVACVIKASEIIDSATPSTTGLDWAKATINNPVSAGNAVAYYVVAKNANATLAQIYNATDNAVKTNVDAAVDVLYGV